MRDEKVTATHPCSHRTLQRLASSATEERESDHKLCRHDAQEQRAANGQHRAGDLQEQLEARRMREEDPRTQLYLPEEQREAEAMSLTTDVHVSVVL